MLGTFTDGNAVAQVFLWKTGFEETAVPEPEPYADQISALADEVLGQLGTE